MLLLVFPLPQPQGGVGREPTRLQRLAVVIVAAPWVHADDVIIREPSPSVMQET